MNETHPTRANDGNEDNRRLKYYWVSKEVMFRSLRSNYGGSSCIMMPIFPCAPERAELVTVVWDDRRGAFGFLLRDKEFAVVKIYDEIPSLQIPEMVNMIELVRK